MPPAARQGDLTAHGGAIVAGFPTVLIEGMPAARQGDMHVCPMVNPGTPPPPHIGGPVAMGSTTVMIGGMPAARMGDMCICSGPPDTIAMGAMTVIIGDAPGSGGGGGGGGGGAGAQAAKYSAAAAESLTPEETVLRTNFLDACVTDEVGRALAGTAYVLVDADGTETTSILGGGGHVRVSGMEAEGDSTIDVMGITDVQWSTSEARPGDEVTITVEAPGVPDGTDAIVDIRQQPALGGMSSSVKALPVTVEGEAIEVTWTYPTVEMDPEDSAARAGGEAGGPTLREQLPQYFAEVNVIGSPQTAATGMLVFQDTVELLVEDDDGEPLADMPYILRLSGTEIRTGTTDGEGVLTEEDVPPGRVEVDVDMDAYIASLHGAEDDAPNDGSSG